MSEEQDPVVKQEREKGHAVYKVVDDIYCETSTFKGKDYASLRRWFKADDGEWYRTKNGLTILKEHMLTLMGSVDELLEFINEH